MTIPEWPKTIGKRGKNTLPDGTVHRFTVVDEITRGASNHPGKVFYLQQIRFDDGKTELRFAYYIIGKKPKMAGKWVWGQFAPFVTAEDFGAIVIEATRQGWI